MREKNQLSHLNQVPYIHTINLDFFLNLYTLVWICLSSWRKYIFQIWLPISYNTLVSDYVP